MLLDLTHLRKDFPVLEREVHPGVPLVYLDSSATSQKPLAVLAAMENYYRMNNANIHRGVHVLAEEATAMYESTRQDVARFVQAPDSRTILFTRNTTESINLVANSWAKVNCKSGDRILLTEMEHHSNLVPWQILSKEKGVILDFVPVTPDGLLDLDVYRKLLEGKPRLVAFTAMSNVLGTINPVTEMTRLAHAVGAAVLVDGAQSVPHMPVDVQELDVDFLAFSAHKMLGPTGIGVLFGKMPLLESMPVFLGGGDMIKTVHLRDFIPNDVPYKFEAGTPAIAEAIGFDAALSYLSIIGMDAIAQHEKKLVTYAMERLEEIPGLTIYGPRADLRGGVIAFNIDNIHPHDIAQVVDQSGVAVRAGHHCAQPLHEKLGLQATTRASFYLYSTREDVDALVLAIYKVKELLG